MNEGKSSVHNNSNSNNKLYLLVCVCINCLPIVVGFGFDPDVGFGFDSDFGFGFVLVSAWFRLRVSTWFQHLFRTLLRFLGTGLGARLEPTTTVLLARSVVALGSVLLFWMVCLDVVCLGLIRPLLLSLMVFFRLGLVCGFRAQTLSIVSFFRQLVGCEQVPHI